MGIKPKGHPTLGWLIFFIWPLGSVFYAFRNYKQKWSKNLLWAYVVFYGYIFTIPENSNIDANSYRDYLLFFNHSNISFSQVLSSYLPTNSFGIRRTNLDLLNPLLTYTTAQFTDDYHILYLLAGVIFGFFFSRNMWMILDKLKGKLKFGTGTIIFLLFFIIPPWNMNGLRFWTASQIFIYGALRYYNNDKKGIWFIFASALSHFTFVLPIILVFLHKKLFKNKYKLYFLLFLITLPLSILTIDSFSNLVSSVIPSVFQDKLDSYTSEVTMKRVQESTARESILTMIYGYFRIVLLLLISGYLFLKYNKLKIHFPDYIKNLLCFVLIFMIFMNIIGFVPSLHRFNTVPFFLMMGAFLIVYQNYNINGMRTLIWILLPFCILYPLGAIYYAANSELTGASYFYKSPFYLIMQIFT